MTNVDVGENVDWVMSKDEIDDKSQCLQRSILTKFNFAKFDVNKVNVDEGWCLQKSLFDKGRSQSLDI